MQLNLIRYDSTQLSLYGKLSMDGVFQCFTLENIERAIPEGNYIVKERWSNHNGRNVLGVIGVPGRTNIEIHIANLPSQLEGCIAVGQRVANDHLMQSTVAFNDLMAKFKEPCTLTIESVKRDVIPAPKTEAIV